MASSARFQDPHRSFARPQRRPPAAPSGRESARAGYNLPPRLARSGRPKRPRRWPRTAGLAQPEPAPPPRPRPGASRLSPQLLPDHAQALLVLADGTVFHGSSIGADGETIGEVVFNTAMTGYQEILTDPSYCRQIVTLTYPQIGNYGSSPEDVESRRSSPQRWWSRTCRRWLQLPQHRLARRLPARRRHGGDRRHRHPPADPDAARGGAQNGCIVALRARREGRRRRSIEAALAQARAAPGMAGLDLAKVVSVEAPYEWKQTSWALGRGHGKLAAPKRHVVAFDYGVKCNILRMLADRGCRITVVPATDAGGRGPGDGPDGVFLANGPGDPEPCDYAIAATRELIDRGLPTFGICLGHQIMGLASRRADLEDEVRPSRRQPSGQGSRRRPGLITSQNHGFAVDPKSMPANLRVTHVSLFDGSIQGLARVDRPPSASRATRKLPGPHDIGYLFDRFVALMDKAGRPHAKAHRPQEHPDHRRRPDRHRPGLRVRLLRRPGLQGAARGGLSGHPRQQQPGDDHDRPGDGRRRPTSSRSPGRWSRRSSPRSGPTRCCRRWAARRR